MEQRIANITVNQAGGTASAGSVSYKLSLPTSWINQLGLSPDNRQVLLSFDGTSITITCSPNFDQFLDRACDLGHDLVLLYYYKNDTLCSRIIADYTNQSVFVENLVSHYLFTAFGNNISPSWADYLSFLDSRCIPASRDGIREYLDFLGIGEYDALEIIRETKGRMAEDQHWLEIQEFRGGKPCQ